MTHSTLKCNHHGREHEGSLQKKIILSGLLWQFNHISSMVLINKDDSVVRRETWSYSQLFQGLAILGNIFFYLFLILDVIIVFLIWGTESIERYHHYYLHNCCFRVCGEGKIICMYMFPTYLDLCVRVFGYAILSKFKKTSLCFLLEINFTQQRNCVSLAERLLSQVI